MRAEKGTLDPLGCLRNIEDLRVAYVLLIDVAMVKRPTSERVDKTTPYDHLRRARHGELRHHDESGLHELMDDYFAHADDLELVGPTTIRAA